MFVLGGVCKFKNQMGPNPNGPRSVSCDRTFFDTQVFFGVRSGTVLLEISWIYANLRFLISMRYSCKIMQKYLFMTLVMYTCIPQSAISRLWFLRPSFFGGILVPQRRTKHWAICICLVVLRWSEVHQRCAKSESCRSWLSYESQIYFKKKRLQLSLYGCFFQK